MRPTPSTRCSNRQRLSVAGSALWSVVVAACMLMLLNIARAAHAAPGINLSWDECGAAGSELKTFACAENTGMPLTLVASFVPPPNIQRMVGLSADLRIASPLLPDWWKHGNGQCRGMSALSADFDFTSSSVCADFTNGRGAGGYLYRVGGFGSNTARLLVQAAIPIDDRIPLSPDTEYYAFKLRVLPSSVTGSGSCAGCDVPVNIQLREIQLFQPLDAWNDPVLQTPLVRTIAYWQPQTGASPAITSFSPISGPPGTNVTIIGTDLAGATAVRFGSATTEFTVISGTQIRATVPDAARNTGLIQVDSPFGTGISTTAFGLAPTITAIVPEQAPVGSIVAIRGRDFHDVSNVRFNDVSAIFEIVSDSVMRATVPIGATTGPITIENAVGVTISNVSFRIGPVAGTLNLSWDDCGSSGTETKSFACNANDLPAFILVGSFVPPPGVGQLVGLIADLKVGASELPDWWKHGNGQCRAANALTVNSDFRSGPSTCLDPWLGRATGPSRYDIGFYGAETARIHVSTFMSDIHARPVDALREYYGFNVNVLPTKVTGFGACSGCDTPVSLKLNQIQLIQPSTLGYDPIIIAPLVRNEAYWQGTPGPRPHIDAFTPAAGGPGTPVTIMGAHLGGATEVRFGGSSAPFTEVSDAELRATVPADGRTGSIAVKTPFGTGISTNPFTVAPVITSINPQQGQVGSSIQIYGTNFTGVTSVRFNGTTASFSVASDVVIVAVVPESATTGLVVVSNPGGSSTSTSPFVVTIGPPRVDSISPAGGAPGALVTVNGARFTGASSVQLSGASASYQVISDAAIRMTVPTGARTGPVAVTTDRGTSTTSPTFIVAPVIESFEPATGRTGTQVVIRGDNLIHATRVAFGGIPAVFEVRSTAEILATVPGGAQTGPINVTNIGGTVNSTTVFTVQVPQPPLITSFAPRQAAVGASVIITGDHLSTVTAVHFDGVPASFRVNAETQITAIVPEGARDGFISVESPAGIAVSVTTFVVLNSSVIGGGINLSWDDCGTAGARIKTFACDTNAGTPLALVASFEPPLGVDRFIGISAELDITTDQATLPDWWKHGSGQCRVSTGLSTSFDFTGGPYTCSDFFGGQAAGGFAYAVGFGSPARARLFVQAAVEPAREGRVDPGTEYYAFKVNLARSKATGSGSCSGCTVPAVITLKSIQLFQPLEAHFDPTLTEPLNSTVAHWQSDGDSRQPPVIGPNLVANDSFESSLTGWGGVIGTTVDRVADPHHGSFAMRAVSPDSTSEFGVNDSPNWIVSVPVAGSRYRFGAWLKSGTPGFSAQLRVREFLQRGRTQTVGSNWITPTSEWQYVEFEAASLNAGSTLDFQIVCSTASPRTQMLVDDVTIRMIGSGPFMTAATAHTVDPGETVEAVVTANDATGELIRSLVAEVTDLPSGHDATFMVDPDNRRGVLSWTPQPEDAGASYDVTFLGRSILQNGVTTRITVRSTQDAGNLVGDPSFEGQELWRWKPYQGATIAAQSPGRIGNLALRVLGRADSASTFGINDSPNVVGSTAAAGQRYRFTCWVRGDSGAGVARLRVREYVGAARIGDAHYSADLPLTTSWRKLIVEHITGAAGSTLDFHVLAQTNRPGVTFFVDDVSIRALAAAPVASPLVAHTTGELGLERPTVMPNPFGAHATLAMTLARRGPLRIALYDVNGRRVRTVLDGADVAAGAHRFDLDGRNDRGDRLGPGVFFYRIESEGGMRRGRFVVLE